MSHRSKMLLAARRLRQNLSVDTGVEGPYQWGTIASISTGAPSTVGVYLDSSSSVSGAVITTGIPYLSTYTPAVGDVVLIARMSGAARTQRVVVGNLSTYGVVDFGPSATVLGTGSGTDYHYTDVCHFYAGASTQTGTLKIAMPTAAYKSATMQHIVIKGFDYTNNRGPWQVIIGGYNYIDGNWYNYGARIIGRAPFNSVRLAQDGTRNCILLGTTSTVWTYGHIEVTDFYALFGGQQPSIWAPGGWAMSLITSETGITNIFTPVLDQYTDSSTGGLMASYDGAGSFAPTAFGTVPVKIDEKSPSGVSSFVIGGATLPTIYRHLFLEWVARSDMASNVNAAIGLRLNAATGTYDTANVVWQGNATLVSSAEDGSLSYMHMGYVPAATATAGYFGSGEATIKDYNSTTAHKTAIGRTAWTEAIVANQTIRGTENRSSWRASAGTAVTSLTVLLGGGNFIAGSRFTLYGIP